MIVMVGVASLDGGQLCARSRPRLVAVSMLSRRRDPTESFSGAAGGERVRLRVSMR